MARRLLVLLLTALTVAALGAASAGATILHDQDWDVALEGKQTVKWSFSAESPEECPDYLGSPSHEVRGAGTISMAFATKKKNPLWAETYFSGHKLEFMSFSTDGWSIPAVFAKQGKFSMSSGKPCNARADEPEPLPTIADDTGCGKKKTTMGPTLDWSRGDFVLRGSVDFIPERCPGVFEQGMLVDPELPCTPKNQTSGLDGTTLQELHPGLPASEFIKGKKFTVNAHHEWRCEYPSRWPGEPPLSVSLATEYEVVFTPRKH